MTITLLAPRVLGLDLAGRAVLATSLTLAAISPTASLPPAVPAPRTATVMAEASADVELPDLDDWSDDDETALDDEPDADWSTGTDPIAWLDGLDEDDTW